MLDCHTRLNYSEIYLAEFDLSPEISYETKGRIVFNKFTVRFAVVRPIFTWYSARFYAISNL